MLCCAFIPYLSCAGFPSEMRKFVVQCNVDNDRACPIGCEHNIYIHTMICCCRSLKHLKTCRLNHGACVFKQEAEEKDQDTYDLLWCLLNIPEGSIQSFSSYAETDRSNVKVILHSYNAITNRKYETSFRLQNEVDPHSDFLEKNPVCLARYRFKYTNSKIVCHAEGKKITKQEDTLLQM